MKLLFENWRQYLNEQEEAAVLEEGWKDIAMAGAIGLGTILNPVNVQAAAPKPAATQTQQKPRPSVNIKHYGSMEVDDYYLLIGLFHEIDPDAQNQGRMKIIYNLIHNREFPGPKTAKEANKLLEAMKKNPKLSKLHKRLIKEGSQLNVEEFIATTTDRTQKPSGGGGTTRTETTVYKWT
jgi:hypothetical protein